MTPSKIVCNPKNLVPFSSLASRSRYTICRALVIVGVIVFSISLLPASAYGQQACNLSPFSSGSFTVYFTVSAQYGVNQSYNVSIQGSGQALMPAVTSSYNSFVGYTEGYSNGYATGSGSLMSTQYGGGESLPLLILQPGPFFLIQPFSSLSMNLTAHLNSIQVLLSVDTISTSTAALSKLLQLIF